MERNKKKRNEFLQILINVMAIGIFSFIETFLLFFFHGGYTLILVFGMLTVLSVCLLTINLYQFFEDRLGDGTQQKGFEEQLKQLELNMKKTQLLSTKAVFEKMEELQEENKELREEIKSVQSTLNRDR